MEAITCTRRHTKKPVDEFGLKKIGLVDLIKYPVAISYNFKYLIDYLPVYIYICICIYIYMYIYIYIYTYIPCTHTFLTSEWRGFLGSGRVPVNPNFLACC